MYTRAVVLWVPCETCGYELRCPAEFVAALYASSQVKVEKERETARVELRQLPMAVTDFHKVLFWCLGLYVILSGSGTYSFGRGGLELWWP